MRGHGVNVPASLIDVPAPNSPDQAPHEPLGTAGVTGSVPANVSR